MVADWAKPFSETGAKNVTADLYSGAKKWFATIDPGGQKLANYHAGLINSLGFIQIMGMVKPRKLANIYVSLRALPNFKKFARRIRSSDWKPEEEKRIVDARKFVHSRESFNIDRFISDLGYEDIQSLTESAASEDEETAALPDFGDDEDASPTRSVQAIEFVNKSDKLIVLGYPGSGKTTLLKYLALVYSGHLSVKVPPEPLLPIFVPLREVKRAGPPVPNADWLRDLALSCANDISSRAFTKEWLEDALNSGRCLVLLDGVDEVPVSQMNTLFQSIKSFSSKYRANKIIVTCRVAAFEHSIEGFEVCEIDDFKTDDIKLFIAQWYEHDPYDAGRLIRDINSSQSAADLCRTPLLLTLICVLYEHRRSIPTNRAELYEACVDALLFRWDTFRAVDREPLIPVQIGAERKKLLLSRVAYRAFDRNVIYFKMGELRELVQAELEHLNMREISADRLIKEVESHNGLFVEYVSGVYCFSHLTFHEYFTALYYHDTKELADLFNKTVAEPRYIEVFVMCLEKLYNADKLIMQLISHVHNVCLQPGRYDEYLHVLIIWVLHRSAVMNRKLRLVLKEMDIKMEQLDIDDESVVESKNRESQPRT
jgi:predicted NACHT family NTPase